MNISYIPQNEIQDELIKAIGRADKLYWAVAWAKENTVYRHLCKLQKKFTRNCMIFGIDFCGTSPDVLQKLDKTYKVRVYPSSAKGTFHPKIYLFEKLKQAWVFIGSANFTPGALQNNYESMLKITCATNENFYKSLKKQVKEYWHDAEKITPLFIENYKFEYAKKEKRPPHFSCVRFDIPISPLLTMEWDKFVQKIKSNDTDKFKERLLLLQKAQILLSESSLVEFTNVADRQKIAGTKSFHEDGFDWKLFGSMSRATYFSFEIDQNNSLISQALDAIPLKGQIFQYQVNEYKKLTERAMAKAAKGMGKASFSRLLAMKRPDYFVCVDRRNALKLSQALGIPPSHLNNVEKYWDNVVIPITESKWWNADRPINALERKIWDGRAAMLDALYYTP